MTSPTSAAETGTPSADVRPFSNGSEAEYWRAANCDRCRLNGYPKEGVPTCRMEEAVALGFITGTVPATLATEYGATLRGEYCDMPKQCPKFQPPDVCEYIVDLRKRSKPKCGKPAVGESAARGYRYSVCSKHKALASVRSHPPTAET